MCLNNGNGTFAPAIDYVVYGTPRAVVVGDLNGDGTPDLAVANDSNLSVLMNNGNGTFGTPITVGVGPLPTSIAIGDVNGDGSLDLAVSNTGSGTVSVLLNTGNGSFAGAVNYAVGESLLSVALSDFNGDGMPDLAVASYGRCTLGGIGVLLNTGNGGFAAAVNFSVGGVPRSIAHGDLNGDGKPDLAVANDEGVVVLMNASR